MVLADVGDAVFSRPVDRRNSTRREASEGTVRNPFFRGKRASAEYERGAEARITRRMMDGVLLNGCNTAATRRESRGAAKTTEA
jgi:hypothetical protein